MAKVIFEFNRMEDVEFQKKGGFFVGMSVQLEEQSPKEQTGPHDVMAGIIKSMAPEIIEKATQELLSQPENLGWKPKASYSGITRMQPNINFREGGMMIITRKRWSREDREFIEASVGKMTVEEMAKKLNVAPTALQAHARRHGISLCAYRVSEHDKYLCRELYKEGLAIHVIAQKMELSNRAVSSIVYSEY